MSKVEPVPSGLHTVTPHLICRGAATAIDSGGRPPAAPKSLNPRLTRRRRTCKYPSDSAVRAIRAPRKQPRADRRGTSGA